MAETKRIRKHSSAPSNAMLFAKMGAGARTGANKGDGKRNTLAGMAADSSTFTAASL
jgi:hypothetical protein